MVSRAQGALGLLPFAVRLGVSGPGLLAESADAGDRPPVPPEGGGAESRGATESGPILWAGPGKGDTPDRGDRTVPGGRARTARLQDRHPRTTASTRDRAHQTSTTQRR